MEKILDRFLRYVAVDTQSDPESTSQPSAAKELNLLKMLRDELQAMGVEATLDEYGYVMASIPSNCGKDVPAVGFIAHADTAPDASGADIKPQIIENYDGGEIPLKGVPGLSLKPSEFPEMTQYKGQTLITTDGTTLLGADDKAGIAEIMDAVQYIVEHPEFKHGDIKIGFTPDEEIGRGVVKFDVEKFGAKYAYTLDGGQVGELEYENFNAAGATIRIQGRNVHPGTARCAGPPLHGPRCGLQDQPGIDRAGHRGRRRETRDRVRDTRHRLSVCCDPTEVKDGREHGEGPVAHQGNRVPTLNARACFTSFFLSGVDVVSWPEWISRYLLCCRQRSSWRRRSTGHPRSRRTEPTPWTVARRPPSPRSPPPETS